jgi:hypothetical protein
MREIDLGGFKPAVLSDQPAPQLQWLPVGLMVIDDRYQRPLDQASRAAIQRIADGFDWMQFSAVLVAPIAGGRYAVIDGQHRVHAAALVGLETVPAMVVLADLAQQARAFVGVNTTARRITNHQMYRAALEAGEAWAVACRDAVTAAGCSLATYNPTASMRKPGVLYQIMAVRKLVESGKGDWLTLALRGLATYDTRGRVGLYSDYILRPLVVALEIIGRRDLDLATIFRGKDPFHVLDAAKRLRDQGINVTAVEAMRKYLLDRAEGGATL